MDLIPKFILSSGELISILLHTDVHKYLEFKKISGSYVFQDGKISKVPSNELEAVKSPLMGMWEKHRAKKFFEYVQNYKQGDPATHAGLNLDEDPMSKVYAQFSLAPATQDFIGHAMALHLDDDYIKKPARATFDRIILYTSSMARYGSSPYIYPAYGLGELPQAFARLAAVYGGTYMLKKDVQKIEVGADGKFVGVTCAATLEPEEEAKGVVKPAETVKAKIVIGDPSYFLQNDASSGQLRVLEEGKVVRAICILTHPIPNTGDADSVQIILPQNQLKRRHGTSSTNPQRSC